MKIHIRTNTGQGITIQGTLNSSELPRHLAQKMEKLIQPDMLAAAASTPENPDMVDMQQYEITLMPKDRKYGTKHIQFTDAGCSDEMLELLDELIHEIIIKKKRGSK